MLSTHDESAVVPSVAAGLSSPWSSCSGVADRVRFMRNGAIVWGRAWSEARRLCDNGVLGLLRDRSVLGTFSFLSTPYWYVGGEQGLRCSFPLYVSPSSGRYC